jgi:very-short-patch-repair endonuclease
MNVCKFCGSEFENGSGSFCSRSCQGKWCANNCKKSSGYRSEFGRWKCTVCGFIAESRAKLFKHTKSHRLNPDEKCAWNKGLTKDTDVRLKKSGDSYSKKVKSGLIIPSQLGKSLSDEHRKKVSEGMKRAHAEGRAHNIGTCRWNNEPSYPEQFFMKVIENEFDDKDYEREYPFVRFALDFAWVHKKKVIEIDGDQHERFEEYKLRDKEKDKLLIENGWQVLRIKWKDVMKDSKYWINTAKEFIDK